MDPLQIFVKGHYETQGLTNAIHIVTRLDRETSGLMLIAKIDLLMLD